MDGQQRRRFEALLRELKITIPTPFDPWRFGQLVAERRGRPLRVLRLDTADAPTCGLWLATPRSDYIVVDQSAPPVLAGHIACHEVCHMLLGHVGLIPLTGEALGLEHIDPAVVKRVLGRTSRYPTKDERDAEALATYLRSYAGRWTPAPRPRPGDNADARVIDRISATLAGDRRWWR